MVFADSKGKVAKGPRIAFWTPRIAVWTPPDCVLDPSEPDTPPRIETSRPLYLMETCLWGCFFDFLAIFSFFGGYFIDFGPPID